MQNTKIKAVLFDLGETLLEYGPVRTAALFRRAAQLTYEYLRSLGQPVGSESWYYLRNLLSLRWHCWLSSITGRDFDMLELAKKIGRKKGIKLTEQQWEHFAWLWYQPLSRLAKVEPDAAQTLARLKALGLELGIVSNTFVNRCCLEKHLAQLGLLEFFSVRLYSYEFAFRKPNAGIFRIAAERIGQPPENILFVGDRIDADIRPALKAGMHAVLKAAYTNAGKPLPAKALRIERLSEVPALVEKLNQQPLLANQPSKLLAGNSPAE